ncbi:hypothetical protein ACWG8W_06435 [Citricoccus zhacaiensis]
MSTMTATALTDFFQGVERGSITLVASALDGLRNSDLEDSATASKFLAAESAVAALVSNEQNYADSNIEFINSELAEASEIASYADMNDDGDDVDAERFERSIDLISDLLTRRARAEFEMDEASRVMGNYMLRARFARSVA